MSAQKVFGFTMLLRSEFDFGSTTSALMFMLHWHFPQRLFLVSKVTSFLLVLSRGYTGDFNSRFSPFEGCEGVYHLRMLL